MPRVIATVSVDWEGRHIRDENLDAMYHFRQTYPIPLTHFICPAYFTRGPKDCVDRCVAGRIATQVLPGDEVALHVHCWESLVLACGVKPLASPNSYNYCGPDGDPNFLWVPYAETSIDTGQGVALGAYPANDIVTLVEGARTILANNGLGHARGFRAGGWMAPDPVLAALASRFDYDSSATDASLFHDLDQKDPMRLHSWISKIWGPDAQSPAYLANSYTRIEKSGGIQALTQPYTMAITSANLVELPDGGVLADYVSAEWMLELFKTACESTSVKPVFVHVGFHQESAAISYDTLHRVRRSKTDNLASLAQVFQALKKLDLWDRIEFMTARDAVGLYTSS